MISDRFRLAVAQLNPTVGDVTGNLSLVRAAREEAARKGADLLLTSELVLAGYLPEDLVLKPAFVRKCMEAAEQLALETADGGPGVIIGTPYKGDDGRVYNAALLLDQGKIQSVRYKYDLPNYSVFDEKRVFAAGPLPGPVDFRGVRIGIPICEDIWNDEVCECLEETGAELLLVPNGSPYWENRAEERLQVVVARVVQTNLPLVYCNQVGGQDELVFDGGSFALQADRSLALQMPQFATSLAVSDWKRDGETWVCENGPMDKLPDLDEANWRACVMGLGDYVNKNGFPGVVLGLSGGIDSAICAAMAVDALGADQVHAIMLPYRYTSEESIQDAADCAKALGIRYDTVPVAEPVEGFLSALSGMFKGTNEDTTEENLQSRTRGVILMAVSNKFGKMVMTTGNKSEMSVGYATLYGDMNGGYNPIKDLYKTQVYHLADWRNRNQPEGLLGPKGEVIPSNIITKVPTAELRENQTDQDSLPPYDVLDDILECLVEEEMSVGEIEKRGHSRDLIHRIEHLLYIAEYKRRQAPPGVKITERNFGKDRRYPITNRFRDRS
ncbi:NAD+ synthase [Roseibium denhamense]|uniref:Glutamine-dependent NAD(+) synthetase n=1 Tax=Roseibium denhamense TaxID=76305 RepID=A0ABY1NVN6_9HYPH|nr:NAD+ synthase [Roseibium denhamense]MTI05456.1 NAD+ synthase [Roseibium denhamense]SMP18579.1 NH(3)-dependent NAD(+) synthetase [Roseibium denhamense]